MSRGGTRPGAGRPKKIQNTIKLQIAISEHLAEQLPARPGKLIEQLLREHFAKEQGAKPEKQ